MAVNLKRLKLTPPPYTSLSFQKLLNSKTHLPNLPPSHWKDIDFPSSLPDPIDGLQTLELNHPILTKLDSSTTLSQFNQSLAQIILSGIFHHPLAATRAVKKICSLPGSMGKAVAFFNRVEEKDAFLCNLMIRGFVNEGDFERGLGFYYESVIGGFVKENHFTFPVVVRVCGETGLGVEGEKVHCRVVKFGFEEDVYVRNALIRMYSVLGGRIREARRVFDEGGWCDLVSWNLMVDGYVKNGELGNARKVFDEMVERDTFTWNSMVAGYVGVGEMVEARLLFEKMPGRDLISWNCMIDGFCRIEDASSARELFDLMTVRNVVSWNIMLAGYVRRKDYSKCIELYDRMMVSEETRPNEATLVSVLTSCGHLGLLDKGKEIHSYINCERSIEPDVLLSTALLTMYVKCGDMDNAKDVFDQMPEKSVVSWNSMIMGYGTHGCGEKSLEMFLEMEKSGQRPNDATFTCILSTCARTGMLLEGWWYLDAMRRVYKIEPKTEHYGCMVDLLGRAGLLKDSEELIKQIPLKGGSSLWGALHSSCRTDTNSKLGELVGRKIIEEDTKDLGAYLLLSNLYAAEGRWDDVESVRELMKINGVHKVAGSRKRSIIISMLKEMGAYRKPPQQVEQA